MNEYNKDIGNRIRELRELSDITIKEIAKDLNINEETYIQYENAEIDIPASFLYELAQIFKVDLGLLLTGEESRMSIFFSPVNWHSFVCTGYVKDAHSAFFTG